MLIKSSRAHSARHEFISLTQSFCHHHRQEETRTLIRDSLSLSLCVHSLSLSVFLLLLLFVFTFHPQKWALDTKIKTLFPPPLSLVFGRKYTLIIGSNSYVLQLCNQRTPRVLHNGRDLFFCHHRRALSLLRPYEREREREKKKEREERAKTTPTKILYLQNTRNVEKKQVVATAFLPPLERERERERLRNTLHNHAVFCHTSTFTYFAFLLIIIAY